MLTTTSCSPGNSLVGFLMVLFEDSRLKGIFAAITGVDKLTGVDGSAGVPGVVVSAFLRFTPDLTLTIYQNFHTFSNCWAQQRKNLMQYEKHLPNLQACWEVLGLVNQVLWEQLM